MRRLINATEYWKLTPPSKDDGWAGVELDGTLKSVETLWRMVLGMAMQQRAWCIQYDLRHPFRLMHVTSCTVYGLVPPPDEMADLIVRAIDSLTRPTSAIGQLLAICRLQPGKRITRSFWVRYEDETVEWIGSWPRRAKEGSVVLFRGTFPGWDPSVPPVNEEQIRLENEKVQRLIAESRNDVRDLDSNGR